MNNIKMQISAKNYSGKSAIFSNIADDWKQKIRNSKLALSTVKAYENILDKKLMPRLSKHNLSEISKQDCEKIIDYYREKSLSDVYLRMIWTVLSLIMKHAYEENLTGKKFDWSFPSLVDSKTNPINQNSQSKIESAICENDASALMLVMLREKIPMTKLIALSQNDVNENQSSVVLNRKASVSGNSFELKPEKAPQTVIISEESMRIILREIEKHNALEKKFPDSYRNDNGLIFADEHGRIHKPSYYIAKFHQLSGKLGFNVTPKILTEYDYVPQAVSKYTVKNVVSNGKKYSYLKAFTKTNFGRKEILASSVDALNEKIQKSSNRYSFRLTKNLTPFFDYCLSELEKSKHVSEFEREKIYGMLHKYLKSFCFGFTVNQVDDDFQLALMNYLNARKCPFNIKERLVGFLRDVCFSAMKRNFVHYNPFINVYIQPDKPVKYHALNEEEIRKILKLDSNDVNNAFLQVKLLTGMRTAEALGLSWSDVISGEGRIFVRNQIKGGKETTLIHTTKNYRPRKICPPSLTFEILEKIRALTFGNENNKLNLVFCNSDGSPLKPAPIRELLRSVIGREKARLHDLRVTALTVIYEQTKNLALAAKEAGHSDTDVTVQHYVDVKPDLNAAKISLDKYYENMFVKGARQK